MLNDYPITFDNVEIMPWSKWNETREVIEQLYETEAGTDQVDVVRYGKLTVDCEFRCHSDWARIFADFAERDQITVRMYDVKEYDFKIRTMRIRDFKSDPIEFSEKVPDTNGVWNVSFTLKEF